MTHRPALFATLATTLCLATGAWADAPPKMTHLNPGLYAYTIESEMIGMKMKMPPMKMEHCITKADLDNGSALQGQKDAGMTCTYSDVKQSSSRLQVKMSCTMQGGMKMTSVADYALAPNEMSGTASVNMSGGNIPKEMADSKSKFSMKRAGDCKK